MEYIQSVVTKKVVRHAQIVIIMTNGSPDKCVWFHIFINTFPGRRFSVTNESKLTLFLPNWTETGYRRYISICKYVPTNSYYKYKQ